MVEDDKFREREQLKEEFANVTMQMEATIGDSKSYHIISDLELLNAIYYLGLHWIDFHVYILFPALNKSLPPLIIQPPLDPKTRQPEEVYRIFDFGNRFSTSAGMESIAGSRCTGKMLNTVKLVMNLVLERIKTHLGTTELSQDMEIQLAFEGHEISKRMAFKDCILRPENLSISNFEPGEWGELQLRTMETLAAKGYLRGI